MGIQVGDNFDHKSKKPLDNRTQYATLAAMKAVADANINEGCIAYCVATDKYYKFLSTNTVDETLGKWREYSSGGGGGATYSAGDGINIDANNEISTDNMSAADMSEIIDPLPVPSSIDDELSNLSENPLQNKEIYGEFLKRDGNIPFYCTCATTATTSAKVVTANSDSLVASLTTGIRIAVKFTYRNTTPSPTLKLGSLTAKKIKCVDSNGNVSTPVKWWAAGDIVEFIYDGTQWLMQPTLSIVPSDCEYSTDEKIVGTWLDGRPIYQKTITATMPSTSTDGTAKTSEIQISTDNIDFSFITEAFCLDTTDGRSLPLMFFAAGTVSSSKLAYMSAHMYPAGTLVITSARSSNNGRTAYVTVRYVKLMD